MVKNHARWEQQLLDHSKNTKQHLTHQEFWHELFQLIEARVNRLQGEVSVLQEQSNLTEAWQKYNQILDTSRDIFQECLDFLGGLALRYRELDDRILELADELIEDCKRNQPYRFKPPMWVGPTSQEILRMTFGRIIRVRFPEWSIWTLPYVAHEYGHVVYETARGSNEEDEGLYKVETDLKSCISNQIDCVMQQDSDIATMSVEIRRGEARKLVEELFADFLAVFVMGPAYGCAAINLRLSPNSNIKHSTETKSTNLVLDNKRAMMIFYSMDFLFKNARYEWPGSLATELRTLWDRSCSQAITSSTPKESRILEQYVSELASCLVKDAWRGYPFSPDGVTGWAVVESWYNTWQREFQEHRYPTLKDIDRVLSNGQGTLRDALNLAWLLRVFPNGPAAIPTPSNTRPGYESESNPCKQVNQIEKFTKDLCIKITMRPNKKPRKVPGKP
jgi:hypothetical protein